MNLLLLFLKELYKTKIIVAVLFTQLVTG